MQRRKKQTSEMTRGEKAMTNVWWEEWSGDIHQNEERKIGENRNKEK